MAKIKLDPANSSTVEVNPMVIAMKSSQCQLGKLCAHVAAGFGKELQRCKYLMNDADNDDLYCTALVQENKHG